MSVHTISTTTLFPVRATKDGRRDVPRHSTASPASPQFYLVMFALAGLLAVPACVRALAQIELTKACRHFSLDAEPIRVRALAPRIYRSDCVIQGSEPAKDRTVGQGVEVRAF
jgi:hypothetical protein